MEKKLSLTDAEWSVMEQLWAAPGSTGRALTAALEQKTGFDSYWATDDTVRSATLTLLRRLVEKGAVRYEDSGSIRTFFPNITREHAAVRQTRDLLGRVYHGSLSMLVSAMTREEALPQKEIDELYALLNEMEAKKRRD